MIVAAVQDFQSSVNLIKSASLLAEMFGKELGIAILAENYEAFAKQKTEFESFLSTTNTSCKLFSHCKADEIASFCETSEASFLLLQLNINKVSTIRKMLLQCRELRIPYLLYKNTFTLFTVKKLLVPVNFLEEEIEKAQFASAFGRFFGSEIKILQANDYGSKAATTVSRMLDFFEKFSLNVEVIKAKNDSFKVDKEAVEKAGNINADLVIISASREYGLDDLIFGSKELHIVKNSTLPVLLINPRADLYALCD